MHISRVSLKPTRANASISDSCQKGSESISTPSMSKITASIISRFVPPRNAESLQRRLNATHEPRLRRPRVTHEQQHEHHYGERNQPGRDDDRVEGVRAGALPRVRDVADE